MLSAHPQNPHLHQPTPPPTKASFKAWWNHFTFVQRTKKEPSYIREYEKGMSSLQRPRASTRYPLPNHLSNPRQMPFTDSPGREPLGPFTSFFRRDRHFYRLPARSPYSPGSPADHPVFGKPLYESLKYASVPISTANQNGDLYVWGYVPVVVAKCGLYLKENATEVPGTFRVNGSNKRMRELQLTFETPPKYGKNLDWKLQTYTTHDVASVFRRYLTQMPEPVIPHSMYHNFRDSLSKEPHNQDAVISEYKSLIRQMPVVNQYLLLYVLDLLSVFARKSDKNLMTAQNLAVIFRPGILSHPLHEMLPQEHALSQRVLEFLIAHQDWFMLDIPPPNPALVSPPLSSNIGSEAAAPPPGQDYAQHPTANVSKSPHSALGHSGRGQGATSEDDRDRKSAGVPSTDREVEKEQEKVRALRRRTALEQGMLQAGVYGTLEEGDMSASGDSPTVPTFTSGGAVSVTRSRTLPSSKRRAADPAGISSPDVNVAAAAPEKDKERAPRVLLKKQKRASIASQANRTSRFVSGHVQQESV